MRDFCSRTFRHVADGKGLELALELADNLTSETIISDAKRLQQVLKNLLSNALKFTEHGSVRLRVERAASGWSPNHAVLSRVKSVIAFSASDTGIGIPQDKQRIIFEAFQQADGTTSRKYGGTGLGLSISRELTRLLGGEIRLQSAPGVGSTFTLYLPQTYVAQATLGKSETRALPTEGSWQTVMPVEGAVTAENSGLDIILPPPTQSPTAVVHDIEIDDDRHLIQPGDSVLLIVEDDVTFARILVDLAHDRGIRVLVALRGATALPLAREFNPGAITLDITLPDVAGWTILDRLKHDPSTRHIPVHVITGDEDRRRGLALGAMTYLEKSVTKDALTAAFDTIHQSLEKRTRKLLLVTAERDRSAAWVDCLLGPDVEITCVASGGEALAVTRERYLDGIVLDSGLADISATQLVEEIQAEVSLQAPPILVCGPGAASADLEREIRRLARQGVVRYAESLDRLLEETTLFLHRAETDLSETQRELLKTLRHNDSTLAGKKVLVVDDDVRNIFALTTVLEQHNLHVVHAENGRAGIEVLLHTPDVDGVLMDIMMPEMDGYETMRAKLVDLADCTHGFIAVHFRHHDIHQDAIHIGGMEQHLDAGAPVLGVDHVQVMLLEHRGQREDVAHIVVHHQHLLAGQRGVVVPERFEQFALRFRQVGLGAVQEQRCLFQEAVQRLRVSHHTLAGKAPDLAFQIGARRAWAADQYRRSLQTHFRLNFLHQLRGRNVRQTGIEHDSVEVSFPGHSQGLAAGRYAGDFHVGPQQAIHPGGGAVSFRRHQKQFPRAFLQRLMDGVEGRIKGILGDGLFQVGHRAQRQAAAAVFIARNHVHRNVARGRIVLQTIEDRPARHVGQRDIERDRAGIELAGQRQSRRTAQGYQCADAAVVRHVHQNAREGDIVFHNQQHRVARLDQVPVVVDLNIVHHGGRCLGRRGQDDVEAAALRRTAPSAGTTACQEPSVGSARVSDLPRVACAT